MNRLFLALIFCFFSFSVSAQNGIIKGKLINKVNKEPVPFCAVAIDGTAIGANTDEQGAFVFTNLKPGFYNLKTSCIGYKPFILFEVEVNNAKAIFVTLEIEESISEINEIEVTSSAYVKMEESPVSLRTIGVAEIKRNPGGNRDISRVMQSLPGIQISPSFRNDLIVRGGSPNENRFYLEGIEVPVINHFTTQGASGGPVGMLNVDFIKEVSFYAGAFPANRGNALSSVIEFDYKDAREDKPQVSFTVGATDLAATLETPLTKNSGLIIGWRRSYLQFLFQALELPFLPKYDDLQFKYENKLSKKDILEVVGIGALDKVSLNLEANKTDQQKIILNSIPVSGQWNYTLGTRYRHFRDQSYLTIVVSRNHLKNTANKYENNDEEKGRKLFDYDSHEIENKLRIENTARINGWKINVGAGFESSQYDTKTLQQLPNNITLNYTSDISFFKYSVFSQVSKSFFKEKLTTSFGLRADGNTFNNEMSNGLNQLSPRIAASYIITPALSINANVGYYHQLPAYTVMGYRNTSGNLANANSEYIHCIHYVAGLEYDAKRNLRFTVEGFYKNYLNYPFNINDSISIANQGSDFGVVGNAPVVFNNRGRSYGVEFLVQQKLFKNFYGLLSYTFLRSEFENVAGKFVPAAWDAQHMMSITAGKIFKRNWELGLKLRASSGNPYTPYNIEQTVLISNYDLSGNGILDKSKYNALRLDPFYQIDVRIDKKYSFKKWTLDVYLDIQNITNSKVTQAPLIAIERDEAGMPLVDPNNSSSYIPKLINNTSGTLIPGIGIVVVF